MIAFPIAGLTSRIADFVDLLSLNSWLRVLILNRRIQWIPQTDESPLDLILHEPLA